MKQCRYMCGLSQLLCLIISLSSISRGFSQTWTQLADMPGNLNSASDSRIGATSFTVGNKIYMGTGLQLEINQNPKKDIFEYNISTNSWSQRSDIPVQRAFAVSFAINGKGYIGSGNIAGQQGSPSNIVEVLSDFYEYNPSTDTWITKQSIEPSGRWGAVGFTINGKGYIAFGSRGKLGGSDNLTIPLNSIREYDPQTDVWVSKTSAQEGFMFAQVLS